MKKISITFDRIDDEPSGGPVILTVYANGKQVGRLVLQYHGVAETAVAEWRWDRHFAPDEDWAGEDDDIEDVDELLSAIAKATRAQLKQIYPDRHIADIEKIAAPQPNQIAL